MNLSQTSGLSFWKLWSLLLWQEYSSSKRRLVYIVFCLALGVCAVSAVSSFGKQVELTLEANSRLLFGGDVEISDVRTLPTALMEDVQKKPGIENSVLINRITAMATLSNQETKLVDVLAFEGKFPILKGSVTLNPPHSSSTPENGVWVAADFLQAHGLGAGSVLNLMGRNVTIVGSVSDEISRDFSGFALGPRFIMQRSLALELGLLQKTSRFRESLLLILDPSSDPNDFASSVKKTWSDRLPSLRISSHKEDTRSSNRVLKNLRFFLEQVALSTLVLVCLGVITTLAEWLRSRVPDTGIYRALGASPKLPSLILLGLISGVCLVGVGIGILGGQWLRHFVFVPALSGLFPIPLQSLEWTQISLLLPLAGFVLPILFLLPLLIRIRHLSPAGVIRGDVYWNHASKLNQKRDFLIYGLGLAIIFFLYVFASGSYKIGSIVFFVNLALVFCFYYLLNFLIGFFQSRQEHLPLPVQLAIGEISAKKVTSLLIVTLLGIGLFMLASVNFLKNELMASLEQDLDIGSKPNLYLLDVQKDQAPLLVERLKSWIPDASPSMLDQAPMVRARLTKVGGKPVEELDKNKDSDSQGMRQREQNLTFKWELGDSETILNSTHKGSLWAADNEMQFSLEDRFATRIEAKLGDSLEFIISGVTLVGKVTSIRKVQWQSFRPNFFIVAHPKMLEGVPHQVLLTAYGKSPADRLELQSKITKEFPNVSTIDATALLTRAGAMAQGVVGSANALALLLMGASVLILLTSVLSTKQLRRKNTAVLRALGAKSKTLQQSLLLEFLVLGGLSGLLGVLAAQGVGRFLTKWALDLEPHPQWTDWILLWAMGVLATLVFGYGSVRSVLKTKPNQVLREGH
jgi:putative ABC transport system permease protein